MPFYKRDDEEILTAPNFVYGPGFELSAETHAAHVYPVDGWYWFDTLDQAIAFFASQQPVESISPRQLRLQLLKDGLLQQVEAALQALPEPEKTAVKIEYEYATEIRIDNPLVTSIAMLLGFDDAALRDFFQTAKQL
jgi:hypothetical protein